MLSKLLPRTKTFLGIGLIAAVLFILADEDILDIYWLRMITKPIPVLLMAMYLLMQPGAGRFKWLIIIGLLLGMTGDILLEYSPDAFLPGLIAFLLGHIFYIIAFTSDSQAPAWVAAIFIYLFGLAMYSFLEIGDLGTMSLPVLVYIIIITTMVWRALARYHAPGVPQTSAQAGAIGAILFLISDSLLAITMFIFKLPFAGVAVIISYWLGQLGVTLAAAFAISP